MVYDEGFSVSFMGMDYFAFSKYQPKGRDYQSICGETLVGWFHNQQSGERGCYRAVKSEAVEASASLE
jgi:cathepsin C